MSEFWEFVKSIKPLLQSPYLLATDESGYPLNLALNYGYAPIGNRVEDYKPGWGTNYSLLLLIQNTYQGGVIHWRLVGGAVDAVVFHNFLKELVLPTNDKYYLLMDNAAFHKRPGKEKVKCKCEKKKKNSKEAPKIIAPPAPEYLASRNIETRFITPYFPQLNPAEELFNVIKGYVREREPRTEEDLRKFIADKINVLQKESLSKYFKDCLDYEFLLEGLETKSGN
jgi:transposase